jgi:beta-glucanase (GH16 family)
LETGGVPIINGNLNRDELDIEEMFAATSGNQINENQILWEQSLPEATTMVTVPGTPSADYHDYGVLVTPQGTTFYLDGAPIPGHINLPDGTQGSPDKEVMLMFQVGAPGSWLDGNSAAMTGNSWPQYMWAQWIRIYKPGTTSC